MNKILLVGIVILVVGISLTVYFSSSSASSASSVKINGKSVEITKAPMVPTTPAPTTQAPTTQAPTTQAPTTRAPTTPAPTTQAPTTQAPTTRAPTTPAPTTQAPTTQAPTTRAPTTPAPTTQAPTTRAPTTITTELTKKINIDKKVQYISLERYDDDPINLAEIMLFDDNSNKIDVAGLKVIESPAHPAFPAQNLINNNMNDFAHTEAGIMMQNPDNYEMFGDYIPSVIPVEHIAYVTAIGKPVMMINDGGFLKMVTSDGTQLRFISNPTVIHPSILFDESKWNDGYNKIDLLSAYQVRLKSNMKASSTSKLQYMQVILKNPLYISGITIYNRKDCCQDRINGLVVKTMNKDRQLISSLTITGCKNVPSVELKYRAWEGLNISMLRKEEYTSYKNPNWVQVQTTFVGTPIAVSMDGDISALLTNQNKIYYNFGFSPKGWTQIASPVTEGLTDLVINNGKIYLAGPTKGIYMAEYYNKGSNLKWDLINQSFSQISVDGDNLFGIQGSGNIFGVMGGFNGTNTVFREFPLPDGKKCKHVSIKNGLFMFCAQDSSIYFSDGKIMPRRIAGGLKESFSDGFKRGYGINDSGNIFYLDDNTTSNWVMVPGILKRFAVSEGRLFGIGSDNGLYYANN